MRQEIRQYDVVRVVGMKGETPQVSMGNRSPRIGDRACVVEVYADPPGYELECVSARGETEWLASFPADGVTLEYIESALP